LPQKLRPGTRAPLWDNAIEGKGLHDVRSSPDVLKGWVLGEMQKGATCNTPVKKRGGGNPLLSQHDRAKVQGERDIKKRRRGKG